MRQPLSTTVRDELRLGGALLVRQVNQKEPADHSIHLIGDLQLYAVIGADDLAIHQVRTRLA